MASLKLQRARELRQQATPTEARLWRLLRNRRVLGLKFRRQHVVGGVIVDFCGFLLRRASLVLEVDGSIHTMPEQVAYDAARTTHLEARGLRLVRIANADVSAEAVQRLLGGILSCAPSPRRGEGVRG